MIVISAKAGIQGLYLSFPLSFQSGVLNAVCCIRASDDKHPAFKWANLHIDRPSRQDLADVQAIVAGFKG